jgi:molybdate transport system ATP-binding protein
MNDIKAKFRVDWPGFTLNVDLALPGRGVTALFGHSGSGKTTLLRCIAGLERARQGYLSFKGEVWQDDANWLPVHKRPLGYVFQEASLFSHLTVLGNLRYGLQRTTDMHKVSLDQAVELLGIGHLLDRKPDLLSGGERQRVGIARALAVNPRILLMDEPLAALDHKRKQEILPYLERLHDELEIPVLYVSHSPDEVARLADHLVAMEGGRVIAFGPLNETLTRLDLPLAHFDDAGAVIEATVAQHDETYHLTRLDFSGGCLWVGQVNHPTGSKVRARVLARDVSIATQQPHGSSITNILNVRIAEIRDEGPDKVVVRLTVGESMLLSRITRRSRDLLNLTVGMEVFAQVKSVALMSFLDR